MRISLEVHETIQLNDSNIIVEITKVELRVDSDDIPLTQPDPDLLWPEMLDAVRGGE